MKDYVTGGVSGAIAGFITGFLFALVNQVGSIFGVAAFTCVIGILFGIRLGKDHHAVQVNYIRRWTQRFFFLGLILTLPIIIIYGWATGLGSISEYQPTSSLILWLIFIFIAGGITGVVGGLVGGLLFKALHAQSK